MLEGMEIERASEREQKKEREGKGRERGEKEQVEYSFAFDDHGSKDMRYSNLPNNFHLQLLII